LTFVASWHADVVDRALKGFLEVIPADRVEVFDVPVALEMPLLARGNQTPSSARKLRFETCRTTDIEYVALRMFALRGPS